jgi:hypothetical protein
MKRYKIVVIKSLCDHFTWELHRRVGGCHMFKKTAEAVRMYTEKHNCDDVTEPLVKALNADYEYIDLSKDCLL